MLTLEDLDYVALWLGRVFLCTGGVLLFAMAMTWAIYAAHDFVWRRLTPAGRLACLLIWKGRRVSQEAELIEARWRALDETDKGWLRQKAPPEETERKGGA